MERTDRLTFARFAYWTSREAGRPTTFVLAVLVVAVWAVTGPVFHWSDTWQLVINTGTTVVTFLMVFLIQNSQNRDIEALHLKLDELIRANKGARNSLISLEQMSEVEIAAAKQAMSALSERAADPPRRGGRAKAGGGGR